MGRRSGLSPPVEPVNGDPIALASVAGTLVDPFGRPVIANGNAAGLTFKGMAIGDTATSTTFNCRLITIETEDPGYVNGVLVNNVPRTIYGWYAARQTYPALWNVITIYPANRWCSNGNSQTSRFYYTATGTSGGSIPTHTTVGQTVNGWTLVDLNTPPGYFQASSGGDATVYFWLTSPIYAGTTIKRVTIGANAYATTGPNAASNARTLTTGFANNSTLDYPWIAAHVVTPPHTPSTGNYRLEVACDHAFGIDCVQARAWNMAGDDSGDIATASQSELSQIITTASPGGGALEVFAPVVNTTGVPVGDAYIAYQIYPKIGTRVFDSLLDGEGANWRSGFTYSLANGYGLNAVVRHDNGTTKNFYSLTTYGGGAATVAPTHTSGAVTGADGYGWTWIGNDSTKASGNAPARHHFNNDWDGLYKRGFCTVDPAGALTTGTAGVYATSGAAVAASASLANCYQTEQQAAAALRTYHNTSGGGLRIHDDPGGGTIYFKDGVSYTGFGASMQSLPIGCEWLYSLPMPGWTTLPVRVVGGIKIGYRRHWIGAFTSSALDTTTAGNQLFDPQTANTTLLLPTNENYYDGMRWTGLATGGSVISRMDLCWIRNCVFTGPVQLGASVTRQQIADISGCSFSATSIIQISRGFSNRMFGSNMITDPRTNLAPAPFYRYLEGNFVTGDLTVTQIVIVNILNNASLRALPSRLAVWAGNIIESRAADGTDKCMHFAADTATGDLNGVIIRYNTHVGARSNMGYNDLNDDSSLRTNWFEDNNAFHIRNTTSDVYWHTTTRSGLRGGNHAVLMKVGFANNVVFFGSQQAAALGPNTLAGEGDGFNSKFGLNPTAAGEFVSDRSSTGTAAGNGDYHPALTSSLLGMAAGPFYRRFARDGALRRTDGTGAVGAYERAA